MRLSCRHSLQAIPTVFIECGLKDALFLFAVVAFEGVKMAKEDMREKLFVFITCIREYGLKTVLLMREVCSIEFLLVSTVLFPSVIASAGFFVGHTVSASYFYLVFALMLCCATVAHWKRAILYLLLIGSCAIATAYTFSYVGTDAQNYHFPMQYLLRHGWNPVFDSTIEKFSALAGDAQLAIYHALFLPKFSALCGAIAASAFGLFSGDGFLGYVLIISLLSFAFKFARQYWCASVAWAVMFAAALTFSTKITSFLAGQVDYSTYASFCVTMMSLVLYIRDRRLQDLALFFVASSVCMSSKTTGILSCFVLIVMMLPKWYRRGEFWLTLLFLGMFVALVGASPLLTAWIQYGSPFYPSMSFDPRVGIVDITSDFTGNADALSMGYFSRICYAWISPRITVSLIRLFENNPAFNPVFTVCGGVAGPGLWFNMLLLLSALLLVFSKKNIVTWLCLVIFVSSNFAPLKYIGYGRYFPQIWAILPFAVLNFVCEPNSAMWKKTPAYLKRVGLIGLGAVLMIFAGLSFARTIAYQCRMLVQENLRQNLIAQFAGYQNVKVDGWSYRFTNVARFRQAGMKLVKSNDGKVDTVMQPDSALPCYDTHPEFYEELNRDFPICDSIPSLFCKFHWIDVLSRMPNVLWD